MFDPVVLAQIGWTSFATSSCYVLFALAFALTLKVSRVWNFAQAAVTGAAFYGMYAAMLRWNWPPAAGFAFGLAIAVAMSAGMEIWGFRLFRRQRSSALNVFIFTIVFAEFVAYLLTLIFGTEPQALTRSIMSDVHMVGGVAVSDWDLRALGLTALLCAALFAFLRHTRQGQFMQAVADNGELAELYGISANRACLAAFLIAAALVCCGAWLYGTRASMIPATPLELMIAAVIATILGGIGSLHGAAISAVFLSLLQSASVLVIPSQWQGSLVYFVLFAVILLFPTGLRLPARLRWNISTRS